MARFQKWFIFIVSLLSTVVVVVNNLNQLLVDMINPDVRLRTIIGLFVVAIAIIGYVFINARFLGFKKLWRVKK